MFETFLSSYRYTSHDHFCPCNSNLPLDVTEGLFRKEDGLIEQKESNFYFNHFPIEHNNIFCHVIQMDNFLLDGPDRTHLLMYN